MDFSKVRLWQTHFEVHKPVPGLPMPDCVVEEIENSPKYRLDGRQRHDRGGQLSITLEGCGMVRVPSGVVRLTPGKAFLHNHFDPEVCYFYPPGGKDDWRFLWAAFWGEAAEQLIEKINGSYGYIFDVPLDSQLVERLRAYRKCDGEILVLPPLEAASWVYQMLSLFCEGAEHRVRSSAQSAVVAEIQQAVASAPGEDWQVSRLAQRYRISREHLSRIFREQTGESLREYLSKLRLRAAVDLLLQTHLSVKEIAYRCGWQEYAVFYRIFKRRFALSPQELRQKNIRPEI